MALKNEKDQNKKALEQYEHKDKKRLNNPPVGLVDARTDNGRQKKRTYQFDPHLDPQLQWAGKAEHTSFDVPTVSLHVHERIDPRRIIEAVRKKPETDGQLSFFEKDKKPLREAIEFYKHKENWSNQRLPHSLYDLQLREKTRVEGKQRDIPYSTHPDHRGIHFLRKNPDQEHSFQSGRKA